MPDEPRPGQVEPHVAAATEAVPDPAIVPGALIGGFVVHEVLGALDGVWTVAVGADAAGRAAQIWTSTAAAARDPRVRDGVERLARLGVTPEIAEQPLAPLGSACAYNGRLVVVRRLAAGPTLHERLDQGALDPPDAVGLLGRIAGAVDTLHAFGIPHTHLAPSTIVLAHGEPTGAVLQNYGFPAPACPAPTDPALDDIVHYLAPELADGARPGPPADVYALACMLAECLTGRTLFPPGPPRQVLEAHAHEAPPRIAEATGLPDELDDVLQIALSKRPEHRQQSATALLQAVYGALSARPAPAPKPRRHRAVFPGLARRGPMPSRAATATLLALATVVGFATATLRPGVSSSAPSPAAPPAAAVEGASASRRAAVLSQVDRTIDRLEARRADARQALRNARDPQGQAVAATTLARSYRRTRSALPPAADLAEAAPAPELSGTLGLVERAYRAMAASASAQDAGGFRRATRLVLTRERQLDATLERLARAG